MKSVFNGAGYILADDRNSGGKLDEADAVGCSHCQKLMKKHDWQADGGFCHSCDAPVCGPCATLTLTQGCSPFLRVLETALMKQYRREQNARLMGI